MNEAQVRKSLKVLGWILLGLAVAAVIGLFVLGRVSRSGSPPGMADGHLAPCPSSPNCVCSDGPERPRANFIEPMDVSEHTVADVLAATEKALSATGGTPVESETADYYAATYTSSVFGFVDDVELRLDRPTMQLHIRCASRVGHSDMGVNRKRAGAIRAAIRQQLR